MQITMNLDVWNSLPDDLKEVMKKNADRFAEYMVEQHEKLDRKAVEEAKAKGIEVVSWPEEEVANSVRSQNLSGRNGPTLLLPKNGLLPLLLTGSPNNRNLFM